MNLVPSFHAWSPRLRRCSPRRGLCSRGGGRLGDSNHAVLGQAFPTAGGTLHGQGEVKYESILLVLMA